VLERGQGSLDYFLSLRRELGAPFRRHPLGFISSALLSEGQSRLRLHYWPTIEVGQQSGDCQIHNHIFSFKSWVLTGEVENIEYVRSDSGKRYAVYRAEYSGENSILIKTETQVQLKEGRRARHVAGSEYMLASDILHETSRIGPSPACTVLLTNDNSVVAPLVVALPNGLDRYEFRRAIVSESEVSHLIAHG
jgi:hypothetical protein